MIRRIFSWAIPIICFNFSTSWGFVCSLHFHFLLFLKQRKKRWFRLNHHLANLMSVWCIDNLRDWLLSFVIVEKVTLWDWILCYLMCPQTMTQHFKQFCWAVFPHFAVLAHSCWCWATSFLRGSRQMFISHQIRAHRTSYVVVLQHWWKKQKKASSSEIISNWSWDLRDRTRDKSRYLVTEIHHLSVLVLFIVQRSNTTLKSG